MRTIVVATGFDARDRVGDALLQFLNANADSQPGSTWTHPKGAGAKASLQVKLVFTMAEFATALDTEDAYVVYEGHSRYGQGPAFGPPRPTSAPLIETWVPDAKTFPVNPWGTHFRMGYDATDTEAVGDLLEHSVTPAEYDLTSAPAKAFLPDALVVAAKRAAAAGKTSSPSSKNWCSLAGAWRLFDTCVSALAKTTTSRGDQPLAGRHFYVQQPGAHRGKTPPDEFLVAVQVGSADLEKSSLACAVLFMTSCSSHVHFFKPLDKRRRAVKSKCKLYLTANVCSAGSALIFVQQVFKGIDPTSARGSKALVKALNGRDDSGMVAVY